MIYYAKIIKQKTGEMLVEFPDLEGCFSEGVNIEDAINNAKEALDGWLASHCDRNLSIPKPKVRKGKYYFPIQVDIRVAFPIMLRQARKKRKLSQKQVSERLGISQQAYAKLETPLKANPALNTIQKISMALDLNFDLVLAA